MGVSDARTWFHGAVSRLLRVTMRTDKERGSGFPFEVPVIASLETLDLSAQVTFFVGENGSGKSTLLEAIAIATDVPTAGSDSLAHDPTLAAQRELASTLRLAWGKKSRRGFFLRAEDFFGYQKREAKTTARIIREAREMRAGAARSEGDGLLDDERRMGEFIAAHDGQSHGESFLEFFQNRVRREGVYLLDEPEAPLSPIRQLSLVALIALRAEAGAQFVIATHSPIVLGVPGARILSFDGGRITETAYDDLEHVRVTRDFLLNREAILRKLTEP